MTSLRRDATTINMTNVQENEATPKDPTKPPKKHDTLFGPNIGIVSSGPEWTETSQDKTLVDELTPEIVKGWVAKSKEVCWGLALVSSLWVDCLYQTSQPTTTLQALVNLKRPSLRLSPLTPSAVDDSSAELPLHAHGLEFEYDCDAPKCGIRVYVVLSPGHPSTKDATSGSDSTKASIFDTVADGGFDQMLKLEHGAVLELDRFDDVHKADGPSPVPDPKPEEKETNAQTDSTQTAKKKRFTAFIGRRTHRGQSVSGPALAVVDAESPASNDSNTHEKEEGVRVIIKLTALDEDGHGFASANEQLTYLHVVRAGAVPPEGEEDKRPWIVHVVKREATVSRSGYLSVRPSLSFRSVPIPSTSTRSTVYLPRALRPLIHPPTLLIPILLLCPRQRMMSLHLNALSVFPHHVRSFFYLAAIWSRAASVLLTWLNLAPEEPSPTMKRNLLRLGRTMRTTLRTRNRLHLKRKVQEPRPKLSLPRLPIEGRGRPRGGSVLCVDNVRSIVILYWPMADTLFVSLHLTPQDYDDPATTRSE